MNKLTTMGGKSVSLPNGVASVFLGLTVLLASCSSDTDKLAAPNLANPDAVVVETDIKFTPIVFKNIGGGVQANGCAVTTGTLPAGLAISVNSVGRGTCQITGIPTVAITETTFTITATNATGTNTATVALTVTALEAPTLANAAVAMLTAGTALEDPIVFANEGGTVVSCSVTMGLGTAAPFTLPKGLAVAVNSAGTCQITGTPDVDVGAATAMDFEITGTNPAGMDAATISITIAAAAAAN